MCKKSRDETARLKSAIVAEVSSGLKRNHQERELVNSLSLCGNLSLKSSACCDVPSSLETCSEMNGMDSAANGASFSARAGADSPADSESSASSLSPEPLSPISSATGKALTAASVSALSHPSFSGLDASAASGTTTTAAAGLSVSAAEESASGGAAAAAAGHPLSSGFSRFFETAKERCFYQEIPQKKAGFKTIFMERESSKAEKIISDPTNVMVRHFYDLGRFSFSCPKERELDDREDARPEPFSPYSATVTRRFKQSKGKERVRERDEDDEEQREEEVAARKRRAIDLECDA